MHSSARESKGWVGVSIGVATSAVNVQIPGVSLDLALAKKLQDF